VNRPHDPAEAVRAAAAKLGYGLRPGDDKALADAALSWYDATHTVRQVAQRHEWEIPDFRDYIQQHMRHQLLEEITATGKIPVALPETVIHYLDGGFLDPDGRCEVPEQANWQMVELEMRVRVRTPPVDRKAAVRAGLLDGATP
jgi:hypothetical protein